MLDIENQNNYDCDLPIMKSFSRLFCSKLVTCNLCTTIIFDFRNSIPEKKLNKWKLKIKSKPWITIELQVSISIMQKYLKLYNENGINFVMDMKATEISHLHRWRKVNKIISSGIKKQLKKSQKYFKRYSKYFLYEKIYI